jgi:MqsR-controlled colanic acid and biofilm protein A
LWLFCQHLVKFYRSKNTHKSINFLRHRLPKGELDCNCQTTKRCFALNAQEDVKMKKLLYFSAVISLAALPFASMAAQEMSNANVGQMQPFGTVTAKASNLDDLQAKLAEKAKEQGATGYVINSAGGDNRLYGTATIYK